MEFINIAGNDQKTLEAEVITAIELPEDKSEALAAKLSKLTGRQIVLKKTIDESVLGGIVVKIAGNVIDGSLQRKVEALKKQIMDNIAGN